MAAHRHALVSFGAHGDRSRRRRHRRPRVDRQPRLHRAASASGARRRPAPSRRAARRSRPDARGGVGRRAPRRHGVEGAARGDGTGRVAEDERVARHAHLGAHRAEVVVHGRAARRAGFLARDRAPRAGDRDVQMVEGGAARRVSGLQPERQGPHDVLGVFVAAAARCARIGAAHVGRGARLRSGRLHGAHDARRGSPSSAIHTRGSTARWVRWTRCSSWRRGIRRRV